MSSRGKPLLADSESNRCEALTVMTEWKVKNHKEQQCPFAIKLSVGTKRLCYRHALLESLAISINNGTAHILPQPPRPKYGPVATIKNKRA